MRVTRETSRPYALACVIAVVLAATSLVACADDEPAGSSGLAPEMLAAVTPTENPFLGTWIHQGQIGRTVRLVSGLSGGKRSGA